MKVTTQPDGLFTVEAEVGNTEGTETPVCEPSTNCSPMAANITYGLDAYATIVDLKKRVEALEKK